MIVSNKRVVGELFLSGLFNLFIIKKDGWDLIQNKLNSFARIKKIDPFPSGTKDKTNNLSINCDCWVQTEEELVLIEHKIGIGRLQGPQKVFYLDQLIENLTYEHEISKTKEEMLKLPWKICFTGEKLHVPKLHEVIEVKRHRRKQPRTTLFECVGLNSKKNSIVLEMKLVKVEGFYKNILAPQISNVFQIEIFHLPWSSIIQEISQVMGLSEEIRTEIIKSISKKNI